MTIVDCAYWPVIYVRLNLWNKGLNPVFRFTMCISIKLTDVRGVCGTPFSELASPISSTNKILSSSLNMNNLTCRYTTLISHNARFDFYTFEFQILHHTRVVFPITLLNLFPAQILQRIIIQFILKENLFPFQLSYKFSSKTTYISVTSVLPGVISWLCINRKVL